MCVCVCVCWKGTAALHLQLLAVAIVGGSNAVCTFSRTSRTVTVCDDISSRLP